MIYYSRLTIIFPYNSINRTLEFISKKHSYKMINVFAKGNNEKVLAPILCSIIREMKFNSHKNLDNLALIQNFLIKIP